MCGFIVAKEGQTFNDYYLKRRGPDIVNYLTMGGFVFTHYLLHVTGEVNPQPFVSDDIVCIYNGEIYNHPFTRSDGEVIIPLYKEYGIDFPTKLDGEFAIALYDFKERIAIFSTDAFGTKPLWVNGLCAASYQSCIGGSRLAPNTTLVVSFDGAEHHQPVYDFDFENQYKESFDDWIRAFENSIRKRARDNCFIGLSSGYDSGAIACELTKQHIQFKAYGVRGAEDIDILRKRFAHVNGELFQLTDDDYRAAQNYIKENAEEFYYSSLNEVSLHFEKMTDDWGAVGGSFICSKARDEGRRVFISGQGADEILSDYALAPQISSLKGIFPERLKVWPNFYDGCQRAYLIKDEYVCGAYGIEGRYPFLDTSLVQEFLWLRPELKNSEYKAPLYEYLTRNHYPFKRREKIGFFAGHNLIKGTSCQL